MTVQNDKTKEVLLGDGITTVFPYTFALLDKSHIKVYLTDLDGNTTMLESGYSVDTKNCNVIYPYPFGKPLPAGWKMTIMRVVPVTQEMDLINQGALPNETLEKAYDKLTMIAQQLNEESNRSLKADVSVIGAPYQLPAPAPGKAIGWNADGTGMANYDNPGAATVQAEAAATEAREAAQTATEKANAVVAIVDSMVPWYVGDLEPANTFPWMVWVSTADGYIKQRNGADTEWITRAPISGSWGVPVGTIITLAGLPANLPGWVHLTGTTLVRADYPRLWDFALNSNNIVTDEDWFSQKRYGSFSYGDGETTFRVPLLVDFERGYDPASGKTIGQWYEDAFQGHWHLLGGASGKAGHTRSLIDLTPGTSIDATTKIGSGTAEPYGVLERAIDIIADLENGEPRIGPETVPKHVLLPKYIYTGEVW